MTELSGRCGEGACFRMSIWNGHRTLSSPLARFLFFPSWPGRCLAPHELAGRRFASSALDVETANRICPGDQLSSLWCRSPPSPESECRRGGLCSQLSENSGGSCVCDVGFGTRWVSRSLDLPVITAHVSWTRYRRISGHVESSKRLVDAPRQDGDMARLCCAVPG